MKTRIFRLLILCAVIAAAALAILLPYRTYYPTLSASLGEKQETLGFSFLMGARATQKECEATLGHMAQALLKRCPQCSIQKLACKSVLDDEEQLFLSAAPLPYPSGRLHDGVVVFKAP